MKSLSFVLCYSLFLQVSMHYNRDVRARYIVEQPDLPDLLKLMSRRTTCTSGGRRRANGFKTAEEDFWWACGLCFFERRKKSTVKAHVTQRVCQKTSLRKEMRQRRKALGHLKRYASCEFSTEGFEDIEPLAWNSPLSVQLNQMKYFQNKPSDCVPTGSMQQHDCGFKQSAGSKPKCKKVDADYTSCNYGFRSIETQSASSQGVPAECL